MWLSKAMVSPELIVCTDCLGKGREPKQQRSYGMWWITQLFLHPQNKGLNLIFCPQSVSSSFLILSYFTLQNCTLNRHSFLGDLFRQDPISNLLPIYKQLLWNNTYYLFATIALTTERFPAQGWILTITTNSSYTDYGHTRKSQQWQKAAELDPTISHSWWRQNNTDNVCYDST